MLIVPQKVFRRILKLSVAGTRGGLVRFNILLMLDGRPLTTNEISKGIGLDYKTIEYHLRVLEKAGLIASSEEKYRRKYSHSSVLKMNMDVLDELHEELRKSR